MNNKKILDIGIIVILLISLISGCGNKDREYFEDQQKRINETIIEGSKNNGITDMDVISIQNAEDENGNESWYVIQAKSEQFGELDNKEKLSFFSHLSVDGDPGVSCYISCTSGKYGGLRISSQGHEYMYYASGVEAFLYQDGEKVYERGQDREENQNSNEDDVIVIQVPCEKCEGDGKTHDWAESAEGQDCMKCQGTGWIEQVLD